MRMIHPPATAAGTAAAAPGAALAAAQLRDVALEAFQHLADRWRLSVAQRATLLSTSTRTVSRWQADRIKAAPTADQLERISYLIGIFAGLHSILGDTPLADAWVNLENADFGGASPLKHMLGGRVADLAFVRDYVDRWAAGA